MANGGWYGTNEEWDRVERPLLEIDPIVENFIKEYGLSVTKNYKDCPERSIEWGEEVRCLIQIYLVSEENLTFNLWLCASEDRGSERYWKREMPVKAKKIDEFRNDLATLLREGHAKLESWSKNNEQLVFATKLGA